MVSLYTSDLGTYSFVKQKTIVPSTVFLVIMLDLLSAMLIKKKGTYLLLYTCLICVVGYGVNTHNEVDILLLRVTFSDHGRRGAFMNPQFSAFSL